jgi:hypothetical protein
LDVPQVLAGPILRRVEPTQVSVWLALAEPCDVRVLLWEGRAESGQPNPLLVGPQASTIRVGATLHVVLASIVIPDINATSLLPDTLYAYDVDVTPTSRTGADVPNVPFNLTTLGLLDVVESTDAQGNRVVPRVPLGFEPGLLPGFALPPSDLANLNLLYGSCRRPGHPDPDALAMCDDLIFGDDRYKDPRARPHQLFLGGDQIYADDVTPFHMLLVMELAKKLIGTVGADPQTADVIEHVRLDTMLVKDEATAVDPNDPAAAYRVEDASKTAADPDLPVDRAHFPEERRLSLTRRDAQFTSEDGESHVISLGEFAALYLSVWSNALWGTEVPLARFAADPDKPGDNRVFFWDEVLPDKGVIVMPPVVFPDRIAGHLYVAPTWQSETDQVKREKKRKKAEEERQEKEALRPSDLRTFFAIMADFRKSLPKVQRVLANVPTYMMLDDHDVTDDYFLNPIWRDRVLTSALGQAILRNAMVAYALFQDWGNDPLGYRSIPAVPDGPKAQLLKLVPKLFPANASKGPDQPTAEALAHLFGHDLRNQPNPLGRYDSVTPPILWHYTIDGPKHRVIAFDNRTRRSYGGREGPPGNVSADAMVDQIPLPPLPPGREILIVIAPLQVIGPPVLDEIVAPLSYRVFDAVEAFKSDSDLAEDSTTGLRGMTGTNPDAIEAWAFDVETFEHLLARLEPYRRVVLLSGDVHYSSGTVMSYWKGNTNQPARIAQFTSSGFKNVMPAKITFVDRSAGFAQQMVRANLGIDRIAWQQPADDLILFPVGVTGQDLVPVMRSKLQSVPVLLPTWGWPDHNDPRDPATNKPEKASRINPAKPPDWTWRVQPLLDQRADADRPAGIRLLPLDESTVDTQLSSPDTVLDGYRAIAARHQHALNRLRNARQILFRANVGRVRFRTNDDGTLDAIHEVYTTFSDPDQPAAIDPKVEAFLVQEAKLGPLTELPPSTLRQKALQIPAPGGQP